MQLAPCTGCRRHVDVRERACPFCAAAVTGTPQRFAVRGRVTRAAVFAAALVACESTHEAPKPAPAAPTAPVADDGSDDLEKMLDDDHHVANRPATDAGALDASLADAPPPIDASVPVDAGVRPTKKRVPPPPPPPPDLQVEPDRVHLPDHMNIPKPYGAPPARRRVV